MSTVNTPQWYQQLTQQRDIRQKVAEVGIRNPDNHVWDEELGSWTLPLHDEGSVSIYGDGWYAMPNDQGGYSAVWYNVETGVFTWTNPAGETYKPPKTKPTDENEIPVVTGPPISDPGPVGSSPHGVIDPGRGRNPNYDYAIYQEGPNKVRRDPTMDSVLTDTHSGNTKYVQEKK